jgi:hypothetical protein
MADGSRPLFLKLIESMNWLVARPFCALVPMSRAVVNRVVLCGRCAQQTACLVSRRRSVRCDCAYKDSLGCAGWLWRLEFAQTWDRRVCVGEGQWLRRKGALRCEDSPASSAASPVRMPTTVRHEVWVSSRLTPVGRRVCWRALRRSIPPPPRRGLRVR